MLHIDWVWWHVAVIPECGRQRQEEQESKSILKYMMVWGHESYVGYIKPHVKKLMMKERRKKNKKDLKIKNKKVRRGTVVLGEFWEQTDVLEKRNLRKKWMEEFKFFSKCAKVQFEVIGSSQYYRLD